MSRGIMSRVIEESLRPSVEARADSYMMVNVRPGEKVGALLDLLSRLAGMTPSTLMADKLSEALADYAASSARHGPAILTAAETVLKHDQSFYDNCALSILKKRGVIEVENLGLMRMLTGEKKKP